MQNVWRDVISLDWDDLVALVVALGALVGVFKMRRASLQISGKQEVVDLDVADTVKVLFARIDILEKKLEAQSILLIEAQAEIRELQKLEVYLEGKLKEKESHIEDLRKKLETARSRIRHLEEICKRAGINGDDL